MNPLRVTAIAAVAGLAALLIVLPFTGGAVSPGAILWGSLAGVAGALAISLLYASLAIGPMSILSPLTAVISAIVPMSWGLVGGEQLAFAGYIALGLALVAVILVGFVPERGAVRPRPAGILMAIGSGTMIGVFLILLNATPDASGLVPLVFYRGVSGALMFATLGVLWVWRRGRATGAGAATTNAEAGAGEDATASAEAGAASARERRRIGADWRAGLGLAIVCGIVDAAGNTLQLLGLRVGDLSVVSVLTAMYPAGTIVLAAAVLRERIAPVQWVGLALALIAAALFAIA